MKFGFIDRASTVNVSEKAEEILQAAKKVFIEAGYAKFSARAVAKEVGMSLGNLQYYFKSRDDLLEAMLGYTVRQYDIGYQRIFEEAISDPTQRFLKVVEFLLADIRNLTTARFFTELWALANHNAYAANLMDMAYAYHRKNIGNFIKTVNPGLGKKTREHRAAQIAMTIDGLMLLVGGGKPYHSELAGIDEDLKRNILRMVMEA